MKYKLKNKAGVEIEIDGEGMGCYYIAILKGLGFVITETVPNKQDGTETFMAALRSIQESLNCTTDQALAVYNYAKERGI